MKTKRKKLEPKPEPEFEVEKKFILTPRQKALLIIGATFDGVENMTDAYFDDDKHSLTTKDWWLRDRSGRWQLKIPRNDSIEKRVSDNYVEVTNDQDIKKHLGINVPLGMLTREILAGAGYRQFSVFRTERHVFKKKMGGIEHTIVMDSMDFGYELCEIELIVKDDLEKTRKIAEGKIINFAKKHGLETKSHVRGKVIEFLYRYDRKHFDMLVSAGVVK